MKTIINVECIDQELVITNSPVIASGGVHENYIAFKFCEKWDGFGKTAVFYRNENDKKYSIVDSDGMCEIPHEVTESEGIMYFGVFGESNGITRTSNILKYKIKQGAILVVSEEPTPDIYHQLLSEYGKIQSEIAVERARINQLSRLEEGSTTGDAELQDIRVGADGKIYENAGEAVRGQVGHVKETLVDNIPVRFVKPTLSHLGVDMGVLLEMGDLVVSHYFKVEDNLNYKITVDGKHNRFIVFGFAKEPKAGDTANEIFRNTTSDFIYNETELQNTGGYKYFLITTAYSYSDYNANIEVIENYYESDSYCIGGIKVYSSDKVDEKIIKVDEKVNSLFSVSIYDTTNGVDGYTINGEGEISKNAEVGYTPMINIENVDSIVISIGVEGLQHAYAFYTSADEEVAIYRQLTDILPIGDYEVPHVPSNVKYMRGIYYLAEKDTYTITTTKTTTMIKLEKSVNELSNKINEVSESVQPKVSFESATIVNGITENHTNNLYLIAVKHTNKYGQLPTYHGYLYLNEVEQKLYYSANKYDNPIYLCDWNSTVANGLSCKEYHCTITPQGDIIFMRRPYNNTIRSNPIIYPHNDYDNPYVIDFGDSIKPFSFVIDNAIDYSPNNDFFMFGEYRGWNEADNDTELYIWKVSAPYNTVDCWQRVLTKYVRHFNSDEGHHIGNEIGHFHTCNYDFYSGNWIVTTGDLEYQVKIFVSSDNGVTWVDQNVDGGQYVRTVGFIFTKDYAWYQTDSTVTNHALYRVPRNVNTNALEFANIEKVCNLSANGEAGYCTAYIREPNGLLMLNRMEEKVIEDDIVKLEFFSLDENKLYILGEYKVIDGYTNFDYQGRYGFPVQAYTHYQPLNSDGIICGGTVLTKPFLLDILGNNKDKLIGNLKIRVY